MDQKIRKLLAGECGNYIFPFFWQHGETEEVLREYMKVIAESSIGAVCVESRPHPDFVGEKWWQDMDVILDEARKRNMKVWILDDSHFPTGYANGVLKNADGKLRRQSLTVRSLDCLKSGTEMEFSLESYQKAAPWELNQMEQHMLQGQEWKLFDDDQLISVTAVREGGKTEADILDLSGQIPSGKIVFPVPEGKWQLKFCILTRNRGPHRDYINMMDEESCRVLIDTVYEPHYQHYAADFGTTIAGFFSDEPEIGNGHLYEMGKKIYEIEDQPWSREVEAELKERWGENYHKFLPLIWEQPVDGRLLARVRYDYMDTVTKAVRKDFSFQLGNWCRDHGVEYIGHLIEDNNQHSRTGSSLGHYFRGLAGEDMSGIDDIGGQVLPQGEELPGNSFQMRDGHFYHYVLGKLASSAAAIEPLKKGRSMCEIFGAYGWSEGVQLEKFLLDHFLVRGVNHYVPHAFSAKDFPDPDCPPHFYAHGNNPQYRHFGSLMKYANRMCELISGGTHIAPVAILYQGESDWCSDCMMMQEPAWLLAEAQIEYDFIPSDVFAEREAYRTEIGSTLKVNIQEYQILIVPKYNYIPKAAADGIAEFLKKGGQVFFVEDYPENCCEGMALPEEIRRGICLALPELLPALEKTEVREVKITPANRRLHYLHYKEETDRYLFVNEDHADYTGEIYMEKKGDCYAYNPWENRLEKLFAKETEEGKILSVTIEKKKPLVVIFDKAEESIHEPLTLSGTKTAHSENWKRSLCRSIDYPAFQKEKRITLPDALAEEEPLFSGFVRYENTISCKKGESLLLEISKAAEGVEVFVNGVSAGIQIAAPYRYDLSGLMKEGKNELRIEVATTLEREMSQHPDPMLAMMGIKPVPTSESGITGMVYIEK